MLTSHLIAYTAPKANEKNIVLWKDYRVTVLQDRLFRLERSENKIFRDEATQSVWFRNMLPQKFTVTEQEGCLTIDTGKCKLVLRALREDCRIKLNGKEMPIDNTGNLLGTSRTLDCQNGEIWCEPWNPDVKRIAKLSTGVCSKSGIALFDDASSLTLGEDGEVKPQKGDGTDEYIFAFGNDYRGAVRALYLITGQVPLIPRYALGNWWSRYYEYTDKEYLTLLSAFEAHNVPLTVATIDMDWHYSNFQEIDDTFGIAKNGLNEPKYLGGEDMAWNYGWTGYTWNQRLFPDYRKFLRQLKERGLKITLNLHPASGVRFWETQYDKMAQAVGIDPERKHYVPFRVDDEKYINAYFSVLLKPYENDGVEFWWIDWQQGTNSSINGLDPLWALNHYHYLDHASNHKTPLILSRYAGIGSHRYAKENVSTVNYYSLDVDNVYGDPADSMTDNVFTAPDGATAPVLNGFIFDKADGSELNAELVGGNGESVKIEYGIAFDKQISVGGLYKLTERDEAGNVTVFYGFMDVLAPELKATATIIGNSEPTELVIAKQNLTGGAAFYYESFSVNEIADADKWSVLTVENGGKKSCYTYGDELPCLNVGGEYLLTVYDRLGNGFSFTVYIIGNPATIDFKSNSDDTEFRLSITLEQKFDTLVSLEIRKDGKLLDGVSTDTLSYTFDRAGAYTVILRDNFGRVISKEYTFNKAKPNGEFSGVDNGGKTKSDVKFTYDSGKFYAVIAKDGQAVKTDRSGEITFTASDENSGIYAIRLIRLTDEENYSDYGFTMNTLASEFDLTVSDGSTTNKNVTVSWTAKDVESVVYSLNGGEPVTLENGGVLSAEGVYTVTATNDLGTQRVKIFTIDKTVEYRVEVGAIPTRNVEVTNENIAVFNGETLSVSVMKNGEPYAYAFGDVLSEEGFYTFRLSDDFGNSATFSVTIDKSVSYSANIGNGLIASETVQFANGEKLTVTVTKDNQVIKDLSQQVSFARNSIHGQLDKRFSKEKAETGATMAVLGLCLYILDECGAESATKFNFLQCAFA